MQIVESRNLLYHFCYRCQMTCGLKKTLLKVEATSKYLMQLELQKGSCSLSQKKNAEVHSTISDVRREEFEKEAMQTPKVLLPSHNNTCSGSHFKPISCGSILWPNKSVESNVTPAPRAPSPARPSSSHVNTIRSIECNKAHITPSVLVIFW